MVDGVLLLVDAAEGPMPQTRFVLKKALEMGHRAIVVINKVDRKDAEPQRVLNETFELFLELGATDDQADFPVVYAVATKGAGRADRGAGARSGSRCSRRSSATSPVPKSIPDAPLQMLVTTLDYDNYRGLTAIGRIFAGRIETGQPLARLTLHGGMRLEKARYLTVHEGLERIDVERAEAGEIVAIAGLEEIAIGETLADPDNPIALPVIKVEAPTVRMTFGVNTSPLTGREGRWGTSRRLRERLDNELRQNVALRVEDTESADTFLVSGRGELHLAILIETMRREGYEFQISRPEVILQDGLDGEKLEPFEEVHIETSPETVGVVVEMLGKRRGQMLNLQDMNNGSVQLTYLVPTRGLLGFRYQFLTATRGMGTMHSIFHDYLPLAGSMPSRSRGSLIAWETGTTTTYGLKNGEERGVLFLGPGVEVYQGMVIGEHQRPGDLDVNVCKARHLDNIRSSTKEIQERLTPPRELSLDECIEYLADDELLEVTPLSLRIRKRILIKHDRDRAVRQNKVMMAEAG